MPLFDNVKFNEVVMFFRQFAVMLKAGIPISDCLYNLHGQNFSKAFKKVLGEIYFDINSGIPLSKAFEKHPKVFPDFFTNMVRIGGVSGTLDKIMSDMADYYENDRKIKKKVSNAMVYPTLILSMVFFVIVFLCLFVIPQFEFTIIQFGGEIPKITKAIINISKFVRDHIIIIIVSIVIIVCTINAFFYTSKGKYIKDTLKFNFPIISDIERNLITARFSKAFVILLESGMNMTDILINLKKMLGNQVFSKRFEIAIYKIQQGDKISSSIAETHLFPPMLTEMINVGEKSGNLTEVLESTGSYFDTQVEGSITKAITIIEPIAIIILGLLVTLVIISVLIPMMSVMNAI